MSWFFGGIVLLATLRLISPQDGTNVLTQKADQRDYLSADRVERFRLMKSPADRARLLAVGATQQPLPLEWRGDGKGPYTLTIGFAEGGGEQRFTVADRTKVYLTNLELGRNYVWSVIDEYGESASGSFLTDAAAPRFLKAGGVGNFRDLGGWVTQSGARVRQNLIFRSAGLRFSSKSTGSAFRPKVKLGARRVTDEGIATLRADFKIKTDLELRTHQETAGMETTVLGSGVEWRCISFAAYDFIDNSIRGREPFVKIFRIFADKSNYPILMHCSGGRDRTGTLAFLLNGLLGVSEEDLCRDWECSIFSDPGLSFAPERIEGLLNYLERYPGKTVNARIEAYALSSGVTAEEIAAFRAIMLENR